MWTIINKLPFVLLSLFLFASCNKEEYNMGDARGGNEEIRFEIAVGTSTATPSGVETRVTTSPTYACTFENGDQIGVFIVKGSGGLQPSGNWADNVKLTYNNGTWNPSTPLYHPTGDNPAHFYAYYPYTEGIDPTNFTFSVNSDQSTKANLSKSDLLLASNMNVAKSTNPVSLNFTHALAMVELEVTNGGIGAEMSDRVVTTLQGCKNSVTVNLSTKAATTTGSATSLTMGRVEQSTDENYQTSYTYRAFVPTQMVVANTEQFRFSQTQGTITRTLSHKPSNQFTLVQSIVNRYNITLQGASGSHVYAVGDYYPHKWVPILGVVFEISNGGVNGKIVDLNYIREYAPVPDNATAPIRWGDPTVDEDAAGVVGIRDVDDGYAGTKNLISKRKDQSNFAAVYCVFNWIYQTKNKGDLNGMWYVPTRREIDRLFMQLHILRPTIESVGGSPLLTTFSSHLITLAELFNGEFVYCFGDGGHVHAKDATSWDIMAVAIAKF